MDYENYYVSSRELLVKFLRDNLWWSLREMRWFSRWHHHGRQVIPKKRAKQRKQARKFKRYQRE